MRVLLVNPYYPISETPSPPLGLAYLAAALEQAGVEVKILDFVVFPYTPLAVETSLKNFKPDVVGITSVTMNFNDAIRVIKDVKRTDANILTVMGGPHVTFCGKETLAAFPELDVVVLGEGEDTVVKLVEIFQRRDDFKFIKGIIYRKGTGIHSTGVRELVDLEQLPIPARHLLPLGRYRALGMPISITTSRGCPFQCVFCVGRKMGGAKMRFRNPIRVVDELEYLNTLNFHQINIADDLFTANKNHCLAVCDEIIRRELRFKWTSFARVDTVSPEILFKMKAAGCNAVSFGIESANSKILKNIKKGITLPQAVAAVKMCTEAGITPHASFILGLPGETPATLKETLDFSRELKEMGLSSGFHLLAPFPGTEIREYSRRFGLKILSNDWSEYHANRAIVETPDVTKKMLDDIVMDWENEYHLFLEGIKQRMNTGQTTAAESWQLINLERIVLVYDLMMNRIIEKRGTWPAADSPVEAAAVLNKLVRRINSSVECEENKLHDTLFYSVQQGNLRYVQKNGQTQWEWVDYL
ncbi:MAG: B12-binding domain-containing radical SAM protein [Deltaproteobacteria bacterium]|nr:MAG: B12-binding domain-containing radical SAM protein [Deltaproteobacteria bacterium]